MKTLVSALCLLWATSLAAQSPYLSVSLQMDKDSLHGRDYIIHMQICTPAKLTASSPYGNDSSHIDFRNLKAGNMKCGNPIDSYDPENAFNSFTYSNQDFAFERILKFTVTDAASPNEAMQLVVPVPYQSFVSFIKLEGLVFNKGTTLWVKIENQRDADGRLNVRKSLKG